MTYHAATAQASSAQSGAVPKLSTPSEFQGSLGFLDFPGHAISRQHSASRLTHQPPIATPCCHRISSASCPPVAPGGPNRTAAAVDIAPLAKTYLRRATSSFLPAPCPHHPHRETIPGPGETRTSVSLYFYILAHCLRVRLDYVPARAFCTGRACDGFGLGYFQESTFDCCLGNVGFRNENGEAEHFINIRI
jgi:hypothetical protein